MFELYREQVLESDIDVLWEFISKPENLDRITPSFLAFEIVSDVPLLMRNGLIIEYRIRIPLLGRQQWITEIKHIDNGRSFVDEQRFGPYRFWYHYHELVQQTDGKVLMIDQIRYILPFGIVGKWVHKLFIRPLLERIFLYRSGVFSRLFNQEA